jgi:glyoxylase-like metal-dependent hydrolase (beta-lactamase superfamily II)
MGLTLMMMLGLSAFRAFPSSKQYEVRQISPHAFVWIPEDIMDQSGDPRFSRASNVGFLITSAGVVVLGATNNPFNAREVLYEIRQRTDIPVRLVIDMGPQGDEMLGNEVFAEQRASIISTAAAAIRMRAYQQDLSRRVASVPEMGFHMRGIHLTLPNQTFKGETSFTLGGEEIRLIALPCALPGTSEGDAAVLLPQAGVVFLGDLYVNGYVPAIGSRDIRRWIAVLGEVEKWNADVYIPAHGAPGTRQDLAHFGGFMEWLQGRVEGGIREGKSLIQVEHELLGSGAFYLRAPELAPSAIAAAYRQLQRPRASGTPAAGALPARPVPAHPAARDGHSFSSSH